MSSSRALPLASDHASFSRETSSEITSKALIWHQATNSSRGGPTSVKLEFGVARWRVRFVIF